MPKTRRHNKNCQLCRKPFGSATRHTLLKSYTVNGLRYTDLVICGECKNNIHNWSHKKKAEHHIEKRSEYTKHHSYKPVTIYGKEFKFDGWANTCRFADDKPKQKPVKGTRFVGRGHESSSMKSRLKWMMESQLAILRHKKEVEEFRLAHKGWTKEELKQYNQMMSAEQQQRKEEEIQIMHQLEQEMNQPLMDWLD